MWTTSGVLRDVITAEGNGVEPAANLAVEAIDFGSVDVGGARDTLVHAVFRNVGRAPLVVGAISLGGPDTGAFEVASGVAPDTLMPGEGRDLKIRFMPRMPGGTSGSVLIAHNAVRSPERVRLFGVGIGPELYAMRALHVAAVCDDPPDTMILLYNGGTAPLRID